MNGNTPSEKGSRPRDAACVLLLALLAACVFRAGLDPRAAVVFGHVAQGDVATQFYPWRQYAVDMLRSGSLPLWNPYVLCGYPFAASWQSAVFYPPNLLSLPLPVHVAINWGFAGHVLLSGVFALLFVRTVGGTRFAATVAAVSYMLSSTLVLRVFAGHLSLLMAAAWFPLLLAAAEKRLRARGAAWTALGGTAFCLQILAGHPQVAYYSLAGAALYLACRAAFSPRGARAGAWGRACAFLLSAAVLGACLAAVQLLPGIELVRNSVRGAEAGTAARMVSFPPENLLTLLAPDALGDFVGVFCWGRRFLWGEAVYLGVLPLACALLVQFLRRDRTAGALACLALGPLALAMAAGSPLAGVLMRAVPGLGVVKGPTKALFVSVFALCCLAGLGAQCLAAACALARRRVRVLRLAALVLLLLAGACALDASLGQTSSPAWRAIVTYRKAADPGYWRILDDPAFLRSAYGMFRDGLVRFSLLCAASAGVLVCASRARMSARWAQAVVLGAVIADLWSYHARFLTTVPVSACRWPGDIVRFFAGVDGVSRATRDGRLAVPGINQNMIDRIATYEGYETDGIRAFGEFSDRFRLGGGDVAALLFRPDTLKMASLAGLRYLIVPRETPEPGPPFACRYGNGRLKIYENPHALPRAFVAHRAMVSRDALISLSLMGMPVFDPSAQVVLDEEPAVRPLAAAAPSEARIEKYEPGEVVVRCRCAAPGVLVLADTWYPGWEVTVDGDPDRILRADHAFRGVALRAGEHRVVFRYRPLSFRIGAAISLAAFAALAVWGIGARARGRVAARRGGA